MTQVVLSASPVPTALIDTVEPHGAQKTWTLGDPSETWEAESLGDVGPALARVEQAQRSGLTVAGGIRYEAAAAFDSALVTHTTGSAPLAFFAAFDRAACGPLSPNVPAAVRVSELRPTLDRDGFLRRARSILDHIAAGDVYQVNLTLRADVPLPEMSAADAWRLHLALRRATRAPHAVYLGWPPGRVLSLSPELFLRRRGDVLDSAPMKGTAPRRPDPARDAEVGRWLAEDAKSRAENLMIVDLMRNDLGRVCKAGTIQVPELWNVTAHPTVFQMTSLVRGELRPGTGLADILAATFPPGSVTGAPKVRAMGIIRDLEVDSRGIYCGAVGIFHPGGDFDLSVAIRTIEGVGGGVPRLGLGAGIVADSAPLAEWEETLLKGRFVDWEPFLVPSVDESVQGHTRRIP